MRSLLPFLVSALLCWLAGMATAAAQQTPPVSASQQIDTTALDTVRGTTPPAPLRRAAGDTVAGKEYVMSKSPTTAVLLSIVPGGGQWYNEQYWKIPLFAGVAGYFIYRVIYYQNLFLDKAAEADAVSMFDSRYPILKQQRESYRDNRDLNAAYFIGVEILGMIDAYVGAHLFDFDVDDDVSSRLYFDPLNTAVGFSVRW